MSKYMTHHFKVTTYKKYHLLQHLNHLIAEVSTIIKTRIYPAFGTKTNKNKALRNLNTI